MYSKGDTVICNVRSFGEREHRNILGIVMRIEYKDTYHIRFLDGDTRGGGGMLVVGYGNCFRLGLGAIRGKYNPNNKLKKLRSKY